MKKLIFLLTIMISISCANPEENKAVDADKLETDLIQMSEDFQYAYVKSDWETASQWISSDMGSTIYNSNGSELMNLTEEDVNISRPWELEDFKMINFKVSVSSDQKTAIVTFDANGIIDYNDEMKEDIGYATRASQTWVNENGEWKVMHSHWSPRTNSQGIPQEN